MTSFRLAFLNLWRRKLTSLIALVSIGVSVAGSGLLLRFFKLSESRFATLAHAGDAVVGSKDGAISMLLGSLNLEGSYPGFVPRVLYQSLSHRQNVQFEDGEKSYPAYLKAVVPFLYFAKFRNYRVIGTDEAFLKRPVSEDNPVLRAGRWASGKNEVVVGESVTLAQGVKIGESIKLDAWTGDAPNPLTFLAEIVGIFESQGTSWDYALFSNLETADSILAQSDLGTRSIWKTNVLNYFLVYLEPGGFPPLQALVNQRTVGEVISVPDEKIRLERLTGIGKELGLFLTALILVLGGLGVMAMMVTRFESMAVQLAVLRALGFQKTQIASWLLWEGLLLGSCACLLGAALDGALFPSIRQLLGAALPPSTLVHIPLSGSFPVWVGAILATLAAVFIPMLRLSSQDIHSSLKGM